VGRLEPWIETRNPSDTQPINSLEWTQNKRSQITDQQGENFIPAWGDAAPNWEKRPTPHTQKNKKNWKHMSTVHARTSTIHQSTSQTSSVC
jgi:hypothetical protein